MVEKFLGGGGASICETFFYSLSNIWVLLGIFIFQHVEEAKILPLIIFISATVLTMYFFLPVVKRPIILYVVVSVLFLVVPFLPSIRQLL